MISNEMTHAKRHDYWFRFITLIPSNLIDVSRTEISISRAKPRSPALFDIQIVEMATTVCGMADDEPSFGAHAVT